MRDRAIIAPRIVKATKKGESDPGYLCAAAIVATLPRPPAHPRRQISFARHKDLQSSLRQLMFAVFAMRVGLEKAGGNWPVIYLSTITITGSFSSAGPPAPTYDPTFHNDVAVRSDPLESAKSYFFDTSSWGPFCDVTLTSKQIRQSDSGAWIKIEDYRCRQAFRHFMSRLNRAVYGAASRRYGKRVRVLPVLEKGEVHARALRSWERGTSGRWHIHCAIELPSHFDAVALEKLNRNCWAKVEWGGGRILVRDGANAGWINYMLKDRQKSEFDGFLDCIIIESVHNPIADA